MRTVYIILSVTGWIWFVIGGIYLYPRIKARRLGISKPKSLNEQ